MLAFHSRRHHVAVLDATGTVRHHDKGPRVDTHGSVNTSRLPTDAVAENNNEFLLCCGCQQLLKTIVVAVMLAGLVPLLLGLLFELVIVAPLRVPLDQTPLFYPWQVGVSVKRENIPTI